MTDPKTQIVASIGLVSSPWWTDWLSTVSLVSGTVAAVTGAILGVYGVYKIFVKKEEK